MRGRGERSEVEVGISRCPVLRDRNLRATYALTLVYRIGCRNFQRHTRAQKHTHILVLLPSVKMQVFCFGDSSRWLSIRPGQPRLSRINRSLTLPIYELASVNWLQMKPTFRVSSTASQAGEGNAPLIQYSDLHKKSRKKNGTIGTRH